jgi:hypothetical protein
MRVTRACLAACAVAALGVLVAAQPSSVELDKKGPQIGTRVPAFSGVDQLGRTQTLESVLKSDGAMLVFYRSADW